MNKEEEARQPGRITKILGNHCNNCPFCNYARKKPDTAFGKIMDWHGNWCPAWKAQKSIYGDKQPG